MMTYEQRMAIINSHQFKVIEKALVNLRHQQSVLNRLHAESSGFANETADNLSNGNQRLTEAITILDEAKNNMLLDEDFAKFLMDKS
jgi:ABC-type lipopolysaccharide export system ATPase subunit